MHWAAIGAICVALVVWSFAKHIDYVIKNVWLVKRALDKPQRVLPPPGIVTLNGIVSTIDENCPVQVTIVECGHWRTPMELIWRQTSYTVDAHPFALLLPELGTRITVEPGENVRLRAWGSATGWESDEGAGEVRRERTATLEDGDRVIITGILEEKREVELIASEYRSQKKEVRVEYFLKPIPNTAISIDSETLFHEISERFGNLGWVNGIGTVVLVSAYAYALYDVFSTGSVVLFGIPLVIYAYARFSMMEIDSLPWFDRHTHIKKPYGGIERFKHPFDRR